MNRRKGCAPILIAASAIVLMAPTSGAPQLEVQNYELLRNVRISRTLSEYTYRASVQNSGVLARNVAAALTVTAPGVTVLDRNLGFGDVPASQSVVACDTFTVRHDRTYSFSQSAFQWQASAAPANATPIANAGLDQTVAVGAKVILDGSGSTDVDGQLLGYTWSLVSKPGGSQASLSDAAAVRPTFLVDLAGTYLFELLVSDGQASSVAGVEITTGNVAPRASAGPDQTVPVGGVAYLDGTLSSDWNGNGLNYAWEIVSKPPGSNAVLSDPGALLPSFSIDRAGRYQVRLTVNDGARPSSPDEVLIDTDDSRPRAESWSTSYFSQGTTVTLNGLVDSHAADPDGKPLSYRWALIARPAGSAAALSDAATATPSFTPDVTSTPSDAVQADYVVQLIVSDGCLESYPVTVRVGPPTPVPTPGDVGDAQAHCRPLGCEACIDDPTCDYCPTTDGGYECDSNLGMIRHLNCQIDPRTRNPILITNVDECPL